MPFGTAFLRWVRCFCVLSGHRLHVPGGPDTLHYTVGRVSIGTQEQVPNLMGRSIREEHGPGDAGRARLLLNRFQEHRCVDTSPLTHDRVSQGRVSDLPAVCAWSRKDPQVDNAGPVVRKPAREWAFRPAHADLDCRTSSYHDGSQLR